MTDDSHPLIVVAKHIGDVVSVGVAFATVMALLPKIAALMSIVWYSMRFYDRWRGK